jgi:hypothetical protein
MGAMTHRRCIKRKKRKLARRMMLSSSFRDRVRCETACRLSRADVPALLAGFVNADAVPGVEFGEVLLGSRGEGSFRR